MRKIIEWYLRQHKGTRGRQYDWDDNIKKLTGRSDQEKLKMLMSKDKL